MSLETRSADLGYGETIVVSGLDARFEAGTITAIIGPNGSGKSTVLRALSRLSRPLGGAVLLDGKELRRMNTTVLARTLAVLPQSHPVPEGVGVRDLVALARWSRRREPGNTRRRDAEAVDRAIGLAGLAGFEDRPVATLSGGERQRAWIALALAQEPKLLLLDEPTTHLDLRSQFEILDLVKELNRSGGITVIMVLHDLNHAARYADRIIAIKKGTVAADGDPEETLRAPTVRNVFGVDGIVVREAGRPHFIATGVAAKALALLIGLLAAFHSPQSAAAEDGTIEFAVTATRLPEEDAALPVQTRVIDAREIAESGASSVEEVLQSAGIAGGTDGMGTTITLQGMGGERVLVLVDGRRLIGRVANNLDASSLPVENIERIEIVRGPQSALYGSDAIGGVVNIITKKPADAASLSIDLRSTGLPISESSRAPVKSLFRGQTLDAGADVPIGPLGNRLTLSADHAFPYLDAEDIGMYPETFRIAAGLESAIALSGGKEVSGGGSFSFKRSDDYISSSGSYDRIDAERGDAHLRFKALGPNAELYAAGLEFQRFGREKSQYNSLLDDSSEGGEERQDYLAADLSYAFFPNDRNEFSIFASASRDRLEKYNIDDGEANERNAAALAAQNEFFVPDRFSFLSSLRFDVSDDYGVFASPKLSAGLFPAPGFKLTASAGVGYRAPNFLELYLDSPGTAYHKYGNPDLKPEKSIAASAGADWSGKILSFQGSIYHQELYDEIAYDYTDDEDEAGRQIIVKENLLRSTRSGADLSAETAALGPIAFGARYSYLFAWDRSAGKRLDDQSAHRAGAWAKLGTRPEGPSIRVDADVRSADAHRSSPLATVNAKAEVPIGGGLWLYGGLKNLTGTEDAYTDLRAGPEFYIGVKGAW